MRRPGLRIAAVCAAALAVGSAPAHASFSSVFGDYQGDGTINACAHSPSELKSAEGSIPNDVRQYAPDFPAAVAGALAAHLRGDCDGRTGAAGGGSASGGSGGSNGSEPIQPVPTIAGTPATTGRVVIEAPPAPPTSAVSAKSAPGVVANDLPSLTSDPGSSLSVPLPMIVLAGFGFLGVLALIAWAIGRALGYDWAALAPVRHGFGEMGTRLEGVLDRFRLSRS
jgi:hypothetical protein